MNRIELLEERIKTFPKVYPSYKHEYEGCGINPLYSDIEHYKPIGGNEKIIWALRCDLILAVGVKNAQEYIQAGSTNILDIVHESMHSYINSNDRYGHPSLAMPEMDYDGGVYLGGWLRVHQGRIDVYLLSGRFANPALTALQKQCLEQYLAVKFKLVYKEHDVIFWDHDNDHEIFLFVSNQNFPVEKTRRVYLTENLSSLSVFHPEAQKKEDGASTAIKARRLPI